MELLGEHFGARPAVEVGDTGIALRGLYDLD